jgi:hypothetical protein
MSQPGGIWPMAPELKSRLVGWGTVGFICAAADITAMQKMAALFIGEAASN